MDLNALATFIEVVRDGHWFGVSLLPNPSYGTIGRRERPQPYARWLE